MTDSSSNSHELSRFIQIPSGWGWECECGAKAKGGSGGNRGHTPKWVAKNYHSAHRRRALKGRPR